MKNDKLSVLFKKYLNGECTPEELEVIDRWYQSFENHADDERLLNRHEANNLEEKILGKIKSNIGAHGSQHFLPPQNQPSRFGGLYKIAATFLLLSVIGAGVIFLTFNRSGVEHDQVLTTSDSRFEKLTNTTGVTMIRYLSDGSLISLHPGGSIEFPKEFSSGERNVMLSGEAFFDVAKDKNRPFIINTGEVTIRVLGTSFNVRAYQGSKEITVAVKTGKVSVYDSRKKAADKEIILTPNQEVVFNTLQAKFSKKLVVDPQIILERPTLFEMEYDGTPVGKIFDVLEENYGIDIVYDKSLLAECSLTTSFAEEGFYERIEIICEAIGAEYEIKDGTIVVSSPGCQ